MINRTTFQRIFLVGILLSAFALLSVIVFRYPTSEIWTLRARVAAGQTIKEADVRQLSLPTVVVERFGERIVTSKEALVGKIATISIDPDVPIMVGAVGAVDPSCRTPEQQAAAAASGKPCTALDPRYPALAAGDERKLKIFIPVDLLRSSGGTVVPGDLVNLLVPNGDGTATFILQKVPVVAARSEDGRSVDLTRDIVAGPGGKGTVTVAGYIVAVTPENAQRIFAVLINSIIMIPTTNDAPTIPGVPSAQSAFIE